MAHSNLSTKKRFNPYSPGFSIYLNPQTMVQQPMQQPMQQQYQPQYGQQPYGQQQQVPQFRVIQEFDNNDGNHVRVIEDVATGVVSIERTPLVNNNNRYYDAAVVSAAAIYS